MKNHSVFYKVFISIAIIMLLLGVYYLVPHIWHPFVNIHKAFEFVNNKDINFNAHKKYTAVFFAFGALALLCAFFLRQKKIRYNS